MKASYAGAAGLRRDGAPAQVLAPYAHSDMALAQPVESASRRRGVDRLRMDAPLPAWVSPKSARRCPTNRPTDDAYCPERLTQTSRASEQPEAHFSRSASHSAVRV